MKNKCLLLLLFASFPIFSWADETLDSLLHVLDQTILAHDTYVVQRESRIRHLKELAGDVAPNSIERYNLNNQIYKEYKAFICDSAIYYLNENVRIAGNLGDTDREIESKLQLSLLLSSTGMYTESIDVLKSVDRQKVTSHLILDYYTCFDHVYGEMGFYTQDQTLSAYYREISSAYKDSLYAILSPQSEEFMVMRETLFRDRHKYDEALEINDRRLMAAEPDTPQYALVTYHRSLIYKYLGDKIREKQNLCLSAISDIRSAIKDHASLWMLAQLLYENGDMERAYQYMRFSWNATKFYNARLRSWQSADVLSLIDKTYQAMIEKQNDRLQQYLVLITALLVLLIGALGYIYRQMKKLAVARNHLQTANHQLNQLNEELQQMMDDCRDEGLDPIICSSYRSYRKQKILYEQKIYDLLNEGYSQTKAKNEAATVVAIPGTSEHEIGLAVDIVDDNYQMLENEQENTPVQKWLMKNCWKYGFILRYPENKKKITGVIYEPWHYRYVGKTAAKEIMSKGICLEEYLDE